MANNWNGATANWNDAGDWSGGLPQATDTAAASSGAVSVTDSESVGGIDFSGGAELLIQSGSLDVGAAQLGGAVNNFLLGASGAVVTGTSGFLKIDSYLTGTASGTIYLEGTGSTFQWEPPLSSGPAPETAVDSTALTVDFADGGNGAAFIVNASFDGTVAGFQNGDSINWSDLEGNGSFTSSVGNNSVTLTDSLSHSITINFAGASNQYNASNVSVSSAGVISTTYAPPTPKVGSSTYDASTGNLVVAAATGAGAAPFTASAGDFDPTKLSLTGEDGVVYALTGGVVSNVSGSSFTVTLTAADQLQVDGLLNNNGAASTGNDIFNAGLGPTTYVLSASAGFDVGGTASSAGVTVSHALIPTLSSVVYDPTANVLTLNGSGFEDGGGYGGVNLGQITLTGGNGQSFTFNAADYANAVSSTKAVVDLSSTVFSHAQSLQPGEAASVAALFDKAGAVSQEGTTYNFAATSGWDSGAGAAIATQSVDVICFAAGTRIRTDRGEVAVETLKPNDLALTASGVLKPIRWIGVQTVSLRFADPLRVLPIRIRAGALGDGVPSRDLLISPDHAVLVGETLIQAGALVNGVSVLRETDAPEIFRYYHVETEEHGLIFAENTPAETFIDNVERRAFDNWTEHEALCRDNREMAELPLPRAKSHRQISRRLRAMLAERASGMAARDQDAA